MNWNRVSSTRWERKVDAWEGYFVFTGDLTAKLCDGREHYTIFSKIKLSLDGFTDVVPALEQAWKQVRHQQPQLATTVQGMTRVYEVPDEQALQSWLSSTFVVSKAAEFNELYAGLNPIRKPTLYFLPNTSELVFRAPHYTVDGIGTTLFWETFLSALVSPTEDITFGDEVERLPPVMEEILGFDQPSEASLPLTEKAHEAFAAWTQSMPALQPASQIGQVSSGPCRALDKTLSVGTTQAIVAACKESNITVTAATHAAYIHAIARHPGPSAESSRYASVFQYNLRQYLGDPYSTSEYALSVFYRPLMHRIDLPLTYFDLARRLTDIYKKPFRDHTKEDLALACRLSHVALGAVQTPEFQTAPIPSDALISSLGIVEQKMQRQYSNRGRQVTVEDFALGVDIVLGMDMLFVYTFQDQLRLNYCFNEGFEKPADIQVYLEEMQSILMEELLGSKEQVL